MIHASESDLRHAFHKHHSAVQETKAACSYLLLFYAVECGLKSIWLKRNNLTGTDRIRNPTLLSKDRHNFGVWIKELRLPLQQFQIQNIRRSQPWEESWEHLKA